MEKSMSKKPVSSSKKPAPKPLVFFKCPNTGLPLVDTTNTEDDKIVCNCGKTNPVNPGEAVKDGMVHHAKAFLKEISRADALAATVKM